MKIRFGLRTFLTMSVALAISLYVLYGLVSLNIQLSEEAKVISEAKTVSLLIGQENYDINSVKKAIAKNFVEFKPNWKFLTVPVIHDDKRPKRHLIAYRSKGFHGKILGIRKDLTIFWIDEEFESERLKPEPIKGVKDRKGRIDN